MSANISMDKFGANIVVARTPAWHNLGEVFTDTPDLVEAFERARLNYNIHMLPSLYEFNGKLYDTKGSINIIREVPAEPLSDVIPDPIYLGTVSDNYELHQNMEIAEWFNDLSKMWPVETAGALGDGERIFATLDAGEIEINGEIVHQFFLITDDKTGTQKTKIAYVILRVVCQNTLTSALNSANFTVNVRHTRGSKDKLSEIANLTTRMQSGVEMTNKLFAGMGKAHFSLDEFKTLLKVALYPEPIADEKSIDVSEDFAKLKEQQNLHVESCVSLFSQFNDEQVGLANTKWAAVNAVAEYEDHFRIGRGKGNYSSVLFGTRAKIKADAFRILTKGLKV